jgi:hypothetical protein
MNRPEPRTSLPALIFSEDACLCGERGITKQMPEFSETDELRHAFFKGLRRSREGFLRYCRTPSGEQDYRVYPLVSFGPFRYVFAEKAVLLDTPVVVAFLAPSLTDFYPLMTPSSRYASGTVNRVLFELFYLMNGGSPAFSSLSPEIYEVVRRVPCLAQALFARRSSARCCDLEKILAAVRANVLNTPAGQRFRIEIDTPDASSAAGNIAELPVEAFVSAVTTLTGLLADISADNELHMSLLDHGAVREIALGVRTDQLPDPDLSEGADALYLLPEDYHARIRFLSSICLLSRIDLLVSCTEADIERRETGDALRKLTVSLLVGCEPPPVLDFKYSDPVLAVPGIVEETMRLFG